MWDGARFYDGGLNFAKSIRQPETCITAMLILLASLALDALLEYECSGGAIGVSEAMERGREFFLDHRLYRSHRTGDVVNPAFTRFPFPPQWHFDVLRGLEHFRAAGARPDRRLADAIGVIRRARRRDGTWPVHGGYPGRIWFRLEPAGPSRWATLRALRVLQWWEGDGPRWPISLGPDARVARA